MPSRRQSESPTRQPEPPVEETRAHRLREQAERIVAAGLDDVAVSGSTSDASEVLHELRVHQIELEMQNEELRRAQETLAISRARYFDLYELAPVGYVSLDQDGVMVEVNMTAASLFGTPKESLIQTPFSRFVITEHGDLFHKFRVQRMADRDPGPYSCELRLHVKDGASIWAQLEATNAHDVAGVPVLRIAINDISPRMEAEAELAADAVKLRENQVQLEKLLAQREVDLRSINEMLASIVRVLGEVAEMRDPSTAGHQRRVAELAGAIAAEMGLPGPDVARMQMCGLVHDLGKMSIPAETLNKPGPLSPVEFALVKYHPEAGSHIVTGASFDPALATAVLQHHERCDGSGYPHGLVADQLLPESKILMVADVVEAMISHRPYRAAQGVDIALAEIQEGAGTRYDAEVAAACERLFTERDFTFVEKPTL